jgi:hypothetical protein
MADYLLSDGCRLGATVSDFSYSGSTESIEIPGVFEGEGARITEWSEQSSAELPG